MGSWAEMVGAECDQAEEIMLRTWRGSIDMLAEEMTTSRPNGGRLPWKTGNMARSLLASTASMPKTGGPDEKYAGGSVGPVTAQLDLGDSVWLGFQANYARRMNSGFVGTDAAGRTYNQEGAHFVEAAVDAWPTIVELVAEDVKRAVRGT